MARYQRGEENRMALMEAALELFAENGLKGASVRDITQKAGSSLSSVKLSLRQQATTVSGLPCLCGLGKIRLCQARGPNS